MWICDLYTRFVPWPGQMRLEVFCGWWRRRPFSPEAQRKPCWRDFSHITALRREKTKVSSRPRWRDGSSRRLQKQTALIILPILLWAVRDIFLYVSGSNLLLRGDKPLLFLLGHSHGTDWVEYNTQGWLSHAKHNPAGQNAATLLQDSQKYDHPRLLHIQHWVYYSIICC